MISGIIAEFNPFHNGHRYLLSQASGLKIVLMSGNWMQRGEPAIVDKWVRAKMALENGADIVCELPFFASVQSADYFAVIGTSLQVYPAAGLIDFTTQETPIFYIDPKPIKIPNLRNPLEIIPEMASVGMKILKNKLNKFI